MTQIPQLTTNFTTSPFSTSPVYTNDPQLVGQFVADAETSWTWSFDKFKNDANDVNTFTHFIPELQGVITATNLATVEVESLAQSASDSASTSYTNMQQTTLDASNSATSATNASTSATNAQLSEWSSEAEKLTSNSYALEPEDTFVKIHTSNGDGTFTATDTTDYSAFHWKMKAQALQGQVQSDLSVTDTTDVAFVKGKDTLTTTEYITDSTKRYGTMSVISSQFTIDGAVGDRYIIEVDTFIGTSSNAQPVTIRLFNTTDSSFEGTGYQWGMMPFLGYTYASSSMHPVSVVFEYIVVSTGVKSFAISFGSPTGAGVSMNRSVSYAGTYTESATTLIKITKT